MSGSGLRCFSLYPSCGYGDAACQYLAGMQSLGVPLQWTPFFRQPFETKRPEFVIRGISPGIRASLETVLFSDTPYDTLLLSLPPVDNYQVILDAEPGKRRFGYAAWELDRLPESWLPILNQLDGLFVPSEFNYDVFRDGGVDVPICLAPHVTRKFSQPAELDWAREFKESYVFYTIGTWCARKSLDLVVRAFLDAFTAKDNVCLVIKSGPRDEEACSHDVRGVQSSSWYALASLLAQYPDPPRIHLVTDVLSPENLDAIHALGDCFISLSRSEGWGICPFEALQLGKPVVITGHGGQLSYLGEAYPLLVDYRMVPCEGADLLRHFTDSDSGQWAMPSVEHASELLRNVFEDQDGSRELARRKQAEILERFAPEPVCRTMANEMELL